MWHYFALESAISGTRDLRAAPIALPELGDRSEQVSIALLPRQRERLLLLLIFLPVLCQVHVLAPLKHASDVNTPLRLNRWYEVAGKHHTARMCCSANILSWASRR